VTLEPLAGTGPGGEYMVMVPAEDGSTPPLPAGSLTLQLQWRLSLQRSRSQRWSRAQRTCRPSTWASLASEPLISMPLNS
jgi:hypothetical protein